MLDPVIAAIDTLAFSTVWVEIIFFRSVLGELVGELILFASRTDLMGTLSIWHLSHYSR